MIPNTEPMLWLIAAAAGLAALVIASRAALSGWSGWLEIRRLEIESRRDGGAHGTTAAGSRIELADLRERVRKLEAIATGVDL